MADDFISTSSRWLARLCWLQVVAAITASVAAKVNVESIACTCPPLALLGFVIALFSLGRRSLNLMLFGLFGPVATGLIAVLIALCRWSPGEAADPVFMILILHACATCVWGAMTARQVVRPNSKMCPAEKPTFQFSLLGMLVLLTLTSILLAVFRKLASGGELKYFAAYGITIFVLSLAMATWFWCRVNWARGN